MNKEIVESVNVHTSHLTNLINLAKNNNPIIEIKPVVTQTKIEEQKATQLSVQVTAKKTEPTKKGKVEKTIMYTEEIGKRKDTNSTTPIKEQHEKWVKAGIPRKQRLDELKESKVFSDTRVLFNDFFVAATNSSEIIKKNLPNARIIEKY